MNSDTNEVQKNSLSIAYKPEQINSIDTANKDTFKSTIDKKALDDTTTGIGITSKTKNDSYLKYDSKMIQIKDNKGIHSDDLRVLHNQSNSSFNLKQNSNNQNHTFYTNDYNRDLGANENEFNNSRSTFKVKNLYLYDDNEKTYYPKSNHVSKKRLDLINSTIVDKGFGSKLKTIVNTKNEPKRGAFFYKEYVKPFSTFETDPNFNQNAVLKKLKPFIKKFSKYSV